MDLDMNSKATVGETIFNGKITAILYSKKDAYRFIRDNPKVDQILAITPDVHAELADIELPVICTTDVFTDFSHRRVVARVRCAERNIFQNIDEEENLSLTAKEVLRFYIHLFISNSARIWEIIRYTSHCLIPTKDEWVLVSDRYIIHKHLLKKITSEINFPLIKKSTFSSLCRAINLFAARMLKKSSNLFVNGYSYGMAHLTKEILLFNSTIRIFRISPSSGSLKDFLHPIISLYKSVIGKSTFTLVVNTKIVVPDKREIIVNLFEGIEDKVIKEGINAWNKFLIYAVTSEEGLHKDISMLLNICKPKGILFNYLSLGSSGALAEVANSKKIPCILISHGTHTTHGSATSNYEHQDLARGLLFSPLADVTIAQSPTADKFCNLNYPELKRKRSEPLMWGFKKIQDPPKDGIFRILYTGTCNSFRHWIWETPDEYVSALVDFITKTANISNLRIKVRYRSRPECDLYSLKKLLPAFEHYELKTSGNFLDDLSSANLLISYTSTTIEEAIYSRRPVLLWGHSLRYQHLPASSELPTVNKRNAVYMPRKKSDLVPMIQSIVKAHREDLLSDDEVKDFVWSYNKEQKESLFKDILN